MNYYKKQNQKYKNQVKSLLILENNKKMKFKKDNQQKNNIKLFKIYKPKLIKWSYRIQKGHKLFRNKKKLQQMKHKNKMKL